MAQARHEAEATPRERRSRIKRGRILDAAERLFAQQGYARTTVDEIAVAASVSKGLIYLHFTSKAALLEAVLERELTAWSRASVRSVHTGHADREAHGAHAAREVQGAQAAHGAHEVQGAQAAHGAHEVQVTTADTIARAVRASIDHARRNPLLLGILAQDPRLLLPRPANGEPPRATVEKGYRALLEPLLRRGIARGELRAGLDVARTAQGIWLLHDGLIRALFVGQPDDDADAADALVEATISLIANGIVGPHER